MITRGRPLKVVLVIGAAGLGGAEHQLVRLAVQLHRRGVSVRVLFQYAGGPLTSELDDAFVPWEILRSERSSASSTWGTVGMILRSASRLFVLQPDIVFAWLPGAIWKTLPLAMVLTRARRIAAFRGNLQAVSRHFSYILRVTVRHAHAVTVNAPQLRETAIEWGAVPSRVCFIANGVELAESVSSVDVVPPTAVVIANFKWYKGHDLLIEALSQVSEPLHVRLVGSGEGQRATELLAIERGVRDRITFVAQPADVRAELARAQFAIHPSRTEGLPNAILEELSAGLPVVATNVGGVPLLVDDARNGFLVPSNDAAALAKRITDMAASPELRTTMAEAARSKAEEYGWDACVDSYLRLFRRLVDTP